LRRCGIERSEGKGLSYRTSSSAAASLRFSSELIFRGEEVRGRDRYFDSDRRLFLSRTYARAGACGLSQNSGTQCAKRQGSQRDWDERNWPLQRGQQLILDRNTRLSGCLVCAMDSRESLVASEYRIRNIHPPSASAGHAGRTHLHQQRAAASFVSTDTLLLCWERNNYYLTSNPPNDGRRARVDENDWAESGSYLGKHRPWFPRRHVGNIDGAGDKDGVYFQYWNAVDKTAPRITMDRLGSNISTTC